MNLRMMFAISVVVTIVIMAARPVEIVGIGVPLKYMILKIIRTHMRWRIIILMRSLRLSLVRDLKDVKEDLIS